MSAFSGRIPVKEKLIFISDIFSRRKLKRLCGTTVLPKELKTLSEAVARYCHIGRLWKWRERTSATHRLYAMFSSWAVLGAPKSQCHMATARPFSCPTEQGDPQSCIRLCIHSWKLWSVTEAMQLVLVQDLDKSVLAMNPCLNILLAPIHIHTQRKLLVDQHCPPFCST